MFALTKTAHIN